MVSANQISQLKKFVQHEQAFKQEAIRQYHTRNENTTDAEIMEKGLEESHAQLRYFMDLNKEMMIALGQSEEHAEHLQEGGNHQHGVERYAELLQGENAVLQKAQHRVETALTSECANALTLAKGNSTYATQIRQMWRDIKKSSTHRTKCKRKKLVAEKPLR